MQLLGPRLSELRLMESIVLSVNGQKHTINLDPSESLNHVIRERLGLIGTKRGCETGGCGSCTVIVDGNAIYSCMMYAMQALGKEVTTIEGLQGNSGDLDIVQKSFMEAGGLQCGYCTPGFIMSAKALLDSNPDPDLPEIKNALVGNLCRCTGYTKIFDSIKLAAREKGKKKKKNNKS
jgi:aerobic-type carbon monoxide dehydrogenase small subunit (CoxS/CutS family)